MLLISCSTPPRDWSLMTPAEQRQAIAKISERCNWPVDRFEILEGGELTLQPHPDDSYDSVDCALRELRPVNAKLGFIGNEAPAEAK